jgi:hypothetical protein
LIAINPDHPFFNLPLPLIKAGRRTTAWVRDAGERVISAYRFHRFSDRYPHDILFIAGLPKSGTTWLENMLASFPGYHKITPYDAVRYEMEHGESHSYSLPKGFFKRYRNRLLVIKLHLNGSRHNAESLKAAGIKYIILYRDLRDVAVSYCFYVSRTPWHPDFQAYRKLSFTEKLRCFGDSHLTDYAEWIRQWHQNHDPELGAIVSYESLIARPDQVLTSIANHFGLDSTPEVISAVVERHSLKSHHPGSGSSSPRMGSVIRKGQVGDWKNHFTPEIKELFKRKIGQFLIELSYESDLNW